ncbi:hypothetical protein [Psychromonas hadalis]|uniref:hypothetical protein n=1 Tax=Psychromonas hadalis TaxID=211669 RepID=UPI0003B39F96|nr:hypothetical protein [Psychromonas hadalis]
MTNTLLNISVSLEQLTRQLDAMHLAQLSAFAFSIPQLYFCREYLQLDEQTISKKCLQRLQSGLNSETFTVEKLTALLADKEYFSAAEARSRLAPEPDFESLMD